MRLPGSEQQMACHGGAHTVFVPRQTAAMIACPPRLDDEWADYEWQMTNARIDQTSCARMFRPDHDGCRRPGAGADVGG